MSESTPDLESERDDTGTAERDPNAPPLAFILAGGLGTRVQAVLGDTPKVLAPVGPHDTPFLLVQLRWLAACGVKRVVLCLGVGAGHVRRALKTWKPWPLAVETVMEPRPLGTAGALAFAFEARKLMPDDVGEALVVNGDTLVDLDLAAFRARHLELDAQQTIAVARVDDAGRFGAVRVAADGRITGFVEKGVSGAGLVNAGAYLLDAIALEAIVTSEEPSLERLMQQGESPWLRGAFEVPSFLDIGTPESLEASRRALPEAFAAFAGPVETVR